MLTWLTDPLYVETILPIAVFLILFLLVFGVGIPLVRWLPRRKGSKLAEMLDTNWDKGDRTKKTDETKDEDAE